MLAADMIAVIRIGHRVRHHVRHDQNCTLNRKVGIVLIVVATVLSFLMYKYIVLDDVIIIATSTMKIVVLISARNSSSKSSATRPHSDVCSNRAALLFEVAISHSCRSGSRNDGDVITSRTCKHTGGTCLSH